jgi:hypothetical protein
MSTDTPTTATRVQSADALKTAYQTIHPQASSLSVIADEPAVRARVNDLQARLAVLGITDVSQQGRLVLGDSVVIGQGLRTGVAIQAEPALPPPPAAGPPPPACYASRPREGRAPVGRRHRGERWTRPRRRPPRPSRGEPWQCARRA